VAAHCWPFPGCAVGVLPPPFLLPFSPAGAADAADAAADASAADDDDGGGLGLGRRLPPAVLAAIAEACHAAGTVAEAAVAQGYESRRAKPGRARAAAAAAADAGRRVDDEEEAPGAAAFNRASDACGMRLHAAAKHAAAKAVRVAGLSAADASAAMLLAVQASLADGGGGGARAAPDAAARASAAAAAQRATLKVERTPDPHTPPHPQALVGATLCPSPHALEALAGGPATADSSRAAETTNPAQRFRFPDLLWHFRQKILFQSLTQSHSPH